MSFLKGGREKDHPKEERANFRVMYGYVRPHRFLLATAGALSLATSASSLVLPLVVRDLIADLSSHRGIATLILAMCGLVVATAALGTLGNYVLRRGAESIVLSARNRLVDRLLRLTIGALDRSEPGDLISRVTADATLLRDAIASAFVGATTGVLTVLATLALMGFVDPLLLLVSWGAMTCAGILVALVAPKVGKATELAQAAVGEMGAGLERTLGALRTVKASGAEPRVAIKVHAAASDSWRSNVRAAKWEALILNGAVVAVQGAFLVVLAVGGAQVAAGKISIGTLIAFLLYVSFLMSPITQLIIAITSYQIGTAAVARIQWAERLPVEQLELDEPAADPGHPASVEFDHVHFGYRPELPEVHHGVTFTVPPGGMTAFVGPSGAGKTTVFSLIERFYEPNSGQILINGRNIKDWPLSTLRSAIGYVEQDAPVLSGTLRENLVFGAPGATAEEVNEAVRITRLTDLVERMPDGLETEVGHRGTRLSGGERQRVAIARALLRRPRLLLLDEATSQLDAINEAALRETVADVAQLITVLVVAHRLSTVTLANRIIVMDAGCIQATGTHAELVAANPLYAELAATQFLAADAIAR